ncbi:MAG: glycosyltransferase family 2 protein [Armatimonadetes bacterium]|nr:glycosyltransferase family 2 protein [Armatimonadota bacterium]
MPRVSVLTPTYNHARFIVECIESVRAQSFDDWEMIIVDDGSADETSSLVQACGDDRVTLVEQEHAGIDALAATYNKALQHASGELIAILEGDDFWPVDKLASQVPSFEDPKVVLVSGWTEETNEVGTSGCRLPAELPSADALANSPLGTGAAALLSNRHLTFTFPVSTMIRRSALDAVGGFRSAPGLEVVDLPTFVALAGQGQFAWVSETCGFWRRHGDSVTGGRLPAIIDGAYRLALDWCDRLSSELDVPAETVARLKDEWSAYMVHRLVLLSLQLSSEGDRAAAAEASRLALSFGGTAKRRLKARASLLCTSLGLPSPVARALTQTGGSDIRLNGRDLIVDKGSIERIRSLQARSGPGTAD